MFHFFLVLMILMLAFRSSSQQNRDKTTVSKSDSIQSIERKPETPDPYRLDFGDVFENMHYNQPFRPQVHYTPITGQIADPTGLLKYKGTYHLFYMFDEWSKSRRENKSWGHAISNDCIYWEHNLPLPIRQLIIGQEAEAALWTGIIL